MKLKKYTYITLGWLSFSIGVIGAFLPLLPTVVFWIIAVWFWSKGSPELMEKVYQHPRYGASIKAFMKHGVVSRTAKKAAVSSMAISYLLFQFLARPSLIIGLLVASILLSVSYWLFTRPEPTEEKQ